ncbi:hypothetical protein J132_10536 [Termitomyces sp. J132]|nr:hypothetical protein J132_10536 [Termitomyces sp. J132]
MSNEHMDQLAKKAAQGGSSPPSLLPLYIRSHPLLRSIPATQQSNLVATQVIWKQCWKKSPCIQQLNRTLPSQNYLKLI